MIVLDTNVVSEPLRERPHPAVVAWLRTLDVAGRPVAVTSVTVGELLNGVRELPRGRRRDNLREAVESFLRLQSEQVLAYDEAAARSYAPILDARRIDGRPMGVEDAMIAATCWVHGAALATRNTRDFEGLDLELVNPWDQPT